MPAEVSKNGRWRLGAVFVPLSGNHARHRVIVVNPSFPAKIAVHSSMGETIRTITQESVLVRCSKDLYSWMFDPDEDIEGVAEFV